MNIMDSSYNVDNNKCVIPIISFGTTNVEADKKSIQILAKDIANEYTGYYIPQAFTSSIVRKRLFEQQNIKIQSPEELFQNLLEEKFDTVVVLPTHVMGGEEYQKVYDCVKQFSSKFKDIKICRPLIETQDIITITDTILDTFHIEDNQYLVFMGHGSNTTANEIYHLINKELSKRSVKNMYISTVESTPQLDNAIAKVKEYNPTEVILTPFMLVAGEHAHNDMAVDWKSTFEDLGFNTKCIMKGLGEYPQFRKIYIDRVKEQLC